jgi:hypothetical protein
VRSDLVEVNQPRGGGHACVIKGKEAVQIEEFVPGFAVERLDLSVLRWLTGIDEVQIDAALCAPAQHRVAREF